MPPTMQEPERALVYRNDSRFGRAEYKLEIKRGGVHSAKTCGLSTLTLLVAGFARIQPALSNI
jgi:hypothetical protein